MSGRSAERRFSDWNNHRTLPKMNIDSECEVNYSRKKTLALIVVTLSIKVTLVGTTMLISPDSLKALYPIEAMDLHVSPDGQSILLARIRCKSRTQSKDET